MSHPHILLLEDDQSFGYILSSYLDIQDFQVTWVKSAEEATQILANQSFALALLDITLPGMNGFEFAQIVRSQHPALPFVFLTARSLKVDALKGFRLGAFDYLTKPIDEELLVAKINALLAQTQRTREAQFDEFRIGQYQFLPQRFQLIHPDKERKLTGRETELLTLLCSHRGKLLPRKLALQQIWGDADEFSRKSMDVFISRLRKYLAQDPSIRIENIHGKGFVFDW
ncbi:response regulator transcription factor [Pontibacter sp. G13]|uniref:response regulator transcription factor n=1 Tax=Pontibacter sp. G13 TaxID=3074898 RepID=UPI0028892107|nr:response regulator transcription factor [Pontibacter sp. G13]WNJ17628.1 response regulator transcription factor [Pontibacter sp. G13]